MLPPVSISSLFPYTTLFRSFRIRFRLGRSRYRGDEVAARIPTGTVDRDAAPCARYLPDNRRICPFRRVFRPAGRSRGHVRSEEHTSELQSLRHLVCRLLLEKKKSICSFFPIFSQLERNLQGGIRQLLQRSSIHPTAHRQIRYQLHVPFCHTFSSL